MRLYRRWLLQGGVVAVVAGCGHAGASHRLAPEDSLAIVRTQAAYVQAWLADDTLGVLRTMDSSAVLLPPGHEAVTGHAAIRGYWWPEDGSHTRITGFTWEMQEVMGSGQLAVARGLSTVSWRYEKDSAVSEQTSRNLGLSVLTKDRDGNWRIARQIWGPSLK